MRPIAIGLLVAATLASAPAARGELADVAVRFEVDGLPMPAGTAFPRLPAGLPVALVPEVRVGGDLLTPAQAAREGISLRWLRIEPAEAVTSNQQRDPRTGATRLAVTQLRSVLRPLAVPEPWRVDADLLVRVGTARFMVVVDRPGEPDAASTPGPQAQLELAPGVAGGLSPDVHGLTRRPGEELADVAAELDGVPFLFHPLGEPPLHQTEARVGTDCTSTFVYGMRRLGFELRYYAPTAVWPGLRVRARGLRLEQGRYRDAAGGGVHDARPGDLLHFGNQLSMVVQDRWPFGVLDAHDLLLQAWRSPPHRVTVADSDYADDAAALVRFREDLPRRADAGLTVRVEDSHAGSFFHLVPALARGPATLLLLDQHPDAAPNVLAAELAQHDPDPAWLESIRRRGTIQPYDWVDALLPWGVERALWLGPWDELDRGAEERRARTDLCALATRYPDRGFECRAARYATATREDLLALPAGTPVLLSVDLDYFLRRDGSVDPRRAADVQALLLHFTDVRGVSVALSRPWFPGDAAFEAALRALSAALWSSGRVGAVEVDLGRVQMDDRSLKVKELRAAGIPVPRPRPEELAAVPGYHLAAAPPHATFGLLGDVYLSEASWPVPSTLPFEARPRWQPPERVPLLANLETPVVDDRPVQGFPVFNRHGELLDWLAREGVLVVTLANNHALDQGPEGLAATIEAARRRGIGVVGAWLPGEPGEGVEQLRIGDLRVAVLGVTHGLNARGPVPEGLDVVPFDAFPRTAAGEAAEERFLVKVRRAARDADLVVVLVHGGTEYSPGPSLGQRRFFRALAAAGAKVVAGAHAHVPAGWELDGGALLAWGLGDVVPRRGAAGIGLRVTAERGETGVTVRAEEMAPAGR